MSILITDIRSFTTLSEGMSECPERLVALLNRYFDHMIDAIVEFDGILDKFIGDGILVEYNVPVAQERHPLRAVLTALRMREALTEFNAEQEARGEPTVRMGMGIHTGFAVVGNIGSEGRKVEYTAMGDTVNVASRLQDQTKEVHADIVISTTTYAQVREFVVVGEPMALHVKGRHEPVVAHRLVGLRAGLRLGAHLVAEPLELVRAATGLAGAAGAEEDEAIWALAAMDMPIVPSAPADDIAAEAELAALRASAHQRAVEAPEAFGYWLSRLAAEPLERAETGDLARGLPAELGGTGPRVASRAA